MAVNRDSPRHKSIMLSKKTYKEKIVRPVLELWEKSGRQSKITISGTSMKPLLPEGSQILVEHKTRSIKTGDIVVYLRDNRLISHRVIRIITEEGNKLYLTKGDSALRFDSPLISEREIVGVVKEVLKGENIVDLRKRKWKVVGWVLIIYSFMVGTFSKAANPFLRIFLKDQKSRIT